MKPVEPIPRPRALLLDMDGTITEAMLDFPRIKREMGIGTRPILEALAEMNDADRATAEAVLARHEEEAARHSSLNSGCNSLFAWIADHGVVTGVITRNTRASVQTVLAK